jgi:tight adherence protein B
MRLARPLLGGILAAALAAPGIAFAQTEEEPPAPPPAPEAEVEIINVNLNRYDEAGRVTMIVEFRNLTEPLDPGQLLLTQDGLRIQDAEIELLRNESVTQGVVLVIDTSGSMAENDAIEAAKTAARSFVAQKRPEDFIALVTFASEVNVLTSFTNNSSTLLERIDSIEAAGDTAMFDAIVRAAELYRGASDQLRQNMIVLTDGQDDGSAATVDDAIAAVAGEGIRVFGVALESGEFNPTDLQSIVASANGLFLSTPEPEQLAGIYGQIQRELGNTLVVRFNSPVAIPQDVTFGVTYGRLEADTSVGVPGFVTTTTASPITTTTTFPPPQPVKIESPLPMEAGMLRLLAAVGIGIAAGIFAFILLGGSRSDDENSFARRLAAYGRRGGGVEEEKKPLLQRLPLISRLTSRAEEAARKRGFLAAINSTLEQGNIPLAAGEAIAAAFGLAAVAGLLTALFTLSPIPGLVVFIGAVVLVFAVISFIGKREKKRFEDQLPDTLTLLSTSLRAGYSLLQAVEAVAQEAPNPTAREFGRAIAEARLGVPVTEALNGITKRTQSKDFEWAAIAIEIQREVGGNLAEVLQTVADTMLARNRLKGEIKALTAEGRISAVVLGSLPFAMTAFLWTSNRNYLLPLFEETLGLIAIGVGLVLIAAGIVWLRKIINIEV